MSDIRYYIDEGKYAITGDVLTDNLRIKPYLTEFNFRKFGKSKFWMAIYTPDQWAEFLLWVTGRGWTVEQIANPQTQTPNQKKAKAKTINVIYSYGMSSGQEMCQLRGAGLQLPEAKQYIASKGFKWIFKLGMRRVMAYRAFMSPLAFIEILLHLQGLGLDVMPYSGLSPKRWLYLDRPKTFVTFPLRTGDNIAFESLAKWLTDNGYTRLSSPENPGDFSVCGESFQIWTREEDTLVRLNFDGEVVESIALVDPESTDATFVPQIIINGLIELDVPHPLPAKPLATVPAKRVVKWHKPKYNTTRIQQMNRKFAKLDEKHPFFNMVKFN